MGEHTIAGAGRSSTSMGSYTKASGDYSTVMGFFTQANGWGSTAMGNNSNSSGANSTAMGFKSLASGSNSTAMGDSTIAIADNSAAMGYHTNATGWGSTAMGNNSTASGDNSSSMGFKSTAPSYCETAIGLYNTAYTPGSTNSWWSSDRLFVIGNGTSSSTPSNAFMVLKTGYIAIGNVTPTQVLDVNGNARFRGVSSGTFGYNLNIMSDGTLTTATSDIRMKENILQISGALERVIKLRGVFFNWKNDSSKTKQIGMIAQEVEPIVPEIVFTNPIDGLKGINYSQVSALFVEAMKEQQKQIEGQQQQIESYKSEIQALQEKVEKVESQQNEIDELKTIVNKLVANQTREGLIIQNKLK
jgi:hypothetical protein